MIKAVVFDLDNTIYNYDECHIVAMKQLEEYVCDIPWGKKDVLRNMVKSIGGTFRCVWQVIKKKS